jgi:hypothetical protein
MILPSPVLPASATATVTVAAFAVTDGDDYCLWDYPHPRVFRTAEEAAEAAARVCFHPRRMAGPARVQPVTLTLTRWGTVLSVERA